MIEQVYTEPTNSKSYRGIRTIDVVNSLKPLGWKPIYSSATNSRTKVEEAFHVVRLRNDNYYIENDPVDLVISNSHNRTSTFQIHLGVFRIVCSNSLIAGDHILEPLVIPHKGYLVNMIADVVDLYLAKGLGMLEDNVAQMKLIYLSREEAVNLAEKAFYLKHKEEYEPQSYSDLLNVRRSEDQNNDLWSIYNIIQENLIAGDYLIKRIDQDEVKYRKSKKMKGSAGMHEMNTKLSNMATELIYA